MSSKPRLPLPAAATGTLARALCGAFSALPCAPPSCHTHLISHVIRSYIVVRVVSRPPGTAHKRTVHDLQAVEDAGRGRCDDGTAYQAVLQRRPQPTDATTSAPSRGLRIGPRHSVAAIHRGNSQPSCRACPGLPPSPSCPPPPTHHPMNVSTHLRIWIYRVVLVFPAGRRQVGAGGAAVVGAQRRANAPTHHVAPPCGGQRIVNLTLCVSDVGSTGLRHKTGRVG